MPRPLKLAALAVLFVAIGSVAWRLARPPSPTFATLTPVPGASGFEPANRPSGPILRSKDAAKLDVDFRYGSDAAATDTTLVLNFSPGAVDGTATIAARGSGGATTIDVVRRWDEPRGGYAVAVSDAAAKPGPASALCIKAVIGPSLDAIDLAAGTICAARRDAGGTCHPETLACGLLRPH